MVDETNVKVNNDSLPSKRRQIIIETDGQLVEVIKNELSVLEVKEICRTILMQFGG